MNRRVLFSIFLALNLAMLVFLIGYKAYLLQFPTEVEALHDTELSRIEARVAGQERLRFAVVGNINNSIGIFENRIIPQLNASDADFVISAGNAVAGGGEDKYRALLGTLGHLELPYLLTFGSHEYEEFGSYRFYEHFGPHFYSVRMGALRLVFLDSTGKTPVRWQERWLADLLSGDPAERVIVFMGHPPVEPEHQVLFYPSVGAWSTEERRTRLLGLFDRLGVDAVFSADIATYSDRLIDGIRHVITGGAGGLVLNTEESFHHYLMVTVDPDGIEIEVERLEFGPSPLMVRLEIIWHFIQSLFYVSMVNFLLIFSLLLILTVKSYRLLYPERDYYPDYDIDPTPWLGKPLRVAMFTNTYLPFLGGVPISVARLRSALLAQGHEVMVVAPDYAGTDDQDEPGIHRVRPLVSRGLRGEFTIANILQRGITARLRAFRPDIIHLHHPFWLGSLGLFLARRMRVHSVYTYHTRLEHLAHYLPFPGRLFRNFVSHWLVKRFANKCSAVIVPTNAAKEYMRLIGVARPIFVQPTGIDFDSYQDVGEAEIANLRKRYALGDALVLISASRLSSEKNIDFLIRGAARLRERLGRPFRLLILGEGGERPRLEALIDELGLDDYVTLAGAVSPERMAAHYHLGDAFVFASRAETQGMVVVEAMAAGLPVVAVEASGVDDFVEHGKNGFKTPKNIEAWVQAVDAILADAERRATMAAEARRFARRYPLDAFARSISVVYAYAMATSSRPTRHRQHR